MPDAFTPQLSLIKPEVGASRDSWGAKLNANADALDEFVSMAAPIGMIVDFAGPNAPPGYLICDGRAISRTTYSALFAVIGGYWGAGDGSTTFALPNLNGRSAIGPGSVAGDMGDTGVYTFATYLGAQWRPIYQANLPNYNLITDTQGLHNHDTGNHAGGAAPSGGHTHTTDVQGAHAHGFQTSTESVFHTHSGTTDGVGDHTHSVNAWATSGGGAFASPGGVPTQGGVNTNPAGAHSHTFTSGNQSVLHVHGITVDGNHGHNIYAVGDHQHFLYWDGSHAHNVSLGGGGQWLDIRQPIIVVTKVIYAGQQAVVRALTAVAPTTLEGHDELAAIREELAQLRALVGTPSRRLLSAPLRGSR